MADQPQLRMNRPDLKELPEVELPAGFHLETLQPGWGEAWTKIISESFRESPETYAFDKQMASDPAFAPERIFFVVAADGSPVATASAWHKPEEPEIGIVHYVGALQAWQGNRLGYWVSLQTMHQMVEEERQRVTLLTDDFRLAAIKTYLRLGFEPDLSHESYPERWQAIFTTLNLPELSERFLSC